VSAWHREHPELTGTDADPWMANPAHAAAALEAHQTAVGFSDAWIAEQERRALTFDCEACGEEGTVECEWNGRDHAGRCSECGLLHEYDPDPPGALYLRDPDPNAKEV
jgi:predicted RNA-binding Zn-ribbon protein involved in translation (DUF1610 family)